MSPVPTIRTIIVDDEPLARERLRVLLAAAPDFAVIAECGDGAIAVATIAREHPDLVFLDVQMPEMDGFEVLAALPTDRMPRVIFVTAYDEHAIRAFEVHALDYLLKPFDRDRFAAALARARAETKRDRAAGSNGLRGLREDLIGHGANDRLVARAGGRVLFIPAEEIERVEAAGNYVKLHGPKETYLLRESMAAIEQRLAPERFVRLSRSTIVNAGRIRAIERAEHGDSGVVLDDGTRLRLSRRFREAVEARLAGGA